MGYLALCFPTHFSWYQQDQEGAEVLPHLSATTRQCEAVCHSHQDGVDSAHWEAEHINTPGLVFQDEIQSHTIMPKPPGCCRKSPIVQQTNLDEKAVDDDAEKNQMLELCDNDFKVLIITILQR